MRGGSSLISSDRREAGPGELTRSATENVMLVSPYVLQCSDTFAATESTGPYPRPTLSRTCPYSSLLCVATSDLFCFVTVLLYH